MPAEVFTDGRNAIDDFGTERELYDPETTICYDCGAQWSCSQAAAMRRRNAEGTHSAILDCDFAQTGFLPRSKAFLRTWRLYICLSPRYRVRGVKRPKWALFVGRFSPRILLTAITQFRVEGGVPFCTSIPSDPKSQIRQSERRYVQRDEYVNHDGIFHRSEAPNINEHVQPEPEEE